LSAMKGHEILLCDLDAFFASVEQHDHPETGENRSLSAADQTSARGSRVLIRDKKIRCAFRHAHKPG